MTENKKGKIGNNRHGPPGELTPELNWGKGDPSNWVKYSKGAFHKS